MSDRTREFEVIVIGGGHAGVEAAWAAANMGADVALVTLDPAKIGVMSCNPAIGGLAKGQMVREVDALGGLMGLATDATGIMFKMLNESRGAAVQSPRAQCDKIAYAREVQRLIASRDTVTVIGASAESFIVEKGACRGVVLGSTTEPEWDGVALRAGAVVLTTGTFMRGLMHTGEEKTDGGRSGEAPAVGISATLRDLGFELGRLKTGTPPRLRRSSIDWESLDPQHGDAKPIPFSAMTDLAEFPRMEQVACRVTKTTGAIHEHIRANIHRAPMFSGQIESRGPRYCPSIEDKVVRFADRDAHHVFLEPESHETDWVYCNGIATSLPRDVQEVIVRGLPGCERAEIVLHGYAVEYDMVLPHQIHATGMTKIIRGLFLAGQINGTSGYEEAAGQGLVAGANAVLYARDRGEFVLGRDEAYIGVMMDDLVTKTPREPYRMFTSRAEHRLHLRSDNASDRLTAIATKLGLVTIERVERQRTREIALASLRGFVDVIRVGGEPLAKSMVRPGFGEAEFREIVEDNGRGYDDAILRTVLAERQYEGYIERANREVRRVAKMERRTLPTSFDYALVSGLRAEAREVLSKFRPSTLGQASRLAGVNPADITLLVVWLDRGARERRGATRPCSQGAPSRGGTSRAAPAPRP
ncbi:MAG: tRNA uridine-5-carboxymethylaminomethyl(34) synthesis enzyme MnmG [Phycisphaerales bacterium]